MHDIHNFWSTEAAENIEKQTQGCFRKFLKKCIFLLIALLAP